MGVIRMSEQSLFLARQAVDGADVSQLVTALGSLQRRFVARIVAQGDGQGDELLELPSALSQEALVFCGKFAGLISRAYSSARIYEFLHSATRQHTVSPDALNERLPHLRHAVASDISAHLETSHAAIMEASNLLKLSRKETQNIDYLYFSGACKDPADCFPVTESEKENGKKYLHPMSILTLVWTLECAISAVEN